MTQRSLLHVDGRRIVNPCHCGNRQFRQARWMVFEQCRVVRCTACGQLRTDPEPNDLDAVYSQESEKYNIDHIDDPERREQWSGFSRGIIDDLERVRPGRGRLLDVGCGYGDLLFEARTRHWLAEGLEINQVNARHLQEKGFRIYESYLEEQQVPEDRYDVVVFSQVLEHVPRPNEFLKAVERVLKPGGLVFVAVPCFWSPIPLLLKRSSWYALLPREHVWQFSDASLIRLLKRHGFQPIWRNRGCTSYWGTFSLHPRSIARWVVYRSIGRLRLGDFINVIAVTDKASRPSRETVRGRTPHVARR